MPSPSRQPEAISTPAAPGTLHVGVTSSLLQRIVRHREGLIPGFTRRYGVTRLVWHEAMTSRSV